MPSITRKWRKWMAFGCSHGAFVDWDAVAALEKFQGAYKPDRIIHLGDVGDYAAFRSGAPGTKDEAVSLGDDIRSGVQLIERLAPTDILIGNHDYRIFSLATHHNAIIAHAAGCARNEFLEACNRVKAKLVDHYDARRSWIQLGDFKLLHGWWYNENALRDHAEAYGNVIMAHLHTPGMAHGRRHDNPRGYCVGMLADADRLDYAHRRRATLRWGLGFAWGEYCDSDCQVNISQCDSGKAKSWRLPL